MELIIYMLGKYAINELFLHPFVCVCVCVCVCVRARARSLYIWGHSCTGARLIFSVSLQYCINVLPKQASLLLCYLIYAAQNCLKFLNPHTSQPTDQLGL